MLNQKHSTPEVTGRELVPFSPLTPMTPIINMAELELAASNAREHVERQLAERMAKRVIVIGSGLAGYSAAIAACSYASPIMITGDAFGGSLANAKPLEYWPGAVQGAKHSDLAASLHDQAARLGVKLIHDTAESIDISAKPYVVSLKGQEPIKAEAIIIATGLAPKTLGLSEESELLGRSVFTKSAVMGGPHKDVAVVGDGERAVDEALVLSKMANQVTIVCSANKLTCSSHTLTRLAQTANITVEYETSVIAYVTDDSEGGPLLWQLLCRCPAGVSVVDATAVVLAVGCGPKADLLPSAALTSEGYVKANIDGPSLEGIFGAGSVVEGVIDQAIMIAASAYVAAHAAIGYLESIQMTESSRVIPLSAERKEALDKVAPPEERVEEVKDGGVIPLPPPEEGKTKVEVKDGGVIPLPPPEEGKTKVEVKDGRTDKGEIPPEEEGVKEEVKDGGTDKGNLSPSPLNGEVPPEGPTNLKSKESSDRIDKAVDKARKRKLKRDKKSFKLTELTI
ncbi:MAG: NAD(P)/FAD-dependent oxidoreductase [Candidatus Hodgkinia cicadicola]